MNRVVGVYSDLNVRLQDIPDANSLALLYDDLLVNNIPIIKQFPNALFLRKNELDRFFIQNPAHPARKLFNNSAICPLCGSMIPYGLVNDYRENNGYMSSVCCYPCRYSSNEFYYKIQAMPDNEAKADYIASLF